MVPARAPNFENLVGFLVEEIVDAVRAGDVGMDGKIFIRRKFATKLPPFLCMDNTKRFFPRTLKGRAGKN